MDLQGNVVLVTGATHSIGGAIAEGLREAIQTTQADAQTLVQVAGKISQSVEDLQVLRLTPRRERVD